MPHLCGFPVFCFMFLSTFLLLVLEDTPTQAHPGAPCPSPGVNHFSREPGFFRMVLGTRIWVLSISSVEPCGSWPLCADFLPGCCPVPQGPGFRRPPRPLLEWRFLVWPLGLVDEPKAGTAANFLRCPETDLLHLCCSLLSVSVQGSESRCAGTRVQGPS